MKRKSQLFWLTFFASLCFFSCQDLQNPSAPKVGGATSKAGSSAIDAPTNVTASKGKKGKISIDWNAVNNATVYYIQYAETPFSEFVQIGETSKTTYDDSNAIPGTTGYYRVIAQNAKGVLSSASGIVKGSSLAVPVISSIDTEGEGGDTAKVYWYMSNGSDYEEQLKYTVTATLGSEALEVTVPGNQNFCEFKGLTPNKQYIFKVEAYTDGKGETSDAVTAQTVKNYIPQIPEINISQGEYKDRIQVVITLPPRVQVKTKEATASSEAIYDDYPIYFRIYRRIKPSDANEPWSDGDVLVSKLNYKGKLENDGVDAAYSDYAPGTQILWEDMSAASGISRGVQYQYKIVSYADNNYSNEGRSFSGVKCSNGGALGTGWTPAVPVFVTRDYERVIETECDAEGNPLLDAEGKVKQTAVSATLKFNANWNDLGKASKYRYAVKQSYSKTLNDSNPAETFLSKKTGSGGNVFDSLDAVSELSCEFNIKAEEGQADYCKGFYKYTLYIFPASYKDAAAGSTAPDLLDSVTAPSLVSVTDVLEAPKADSLEATGGYKDKVVLTWDIENGVEYFLKRRKYDADGSSVVEESEIASDEIKQEHGGYTGTFDDMTIEGGVKYDYVLWASNGGLLGNSEAKTVITLGTAAPEFLKGKLSWNSVSVKWPEVTGADAYDVTVGTKTYSFDKATMTDNGSGALTYKVEEPNAAGENETHFTAEINGRVVNAKFYYPAGYSSATESGKPVDFIIKAKSSKDVSSQSVKVWTAGPALTAVSGTSKDDSSDNKAASDTISVSWNMLDGAGSYVVIRERPAYGTKTGAMAAKKDVYIVDSSTAVTVGGEQKTGVSASFKDGRFMLTDTQNNSDVGDGTDAWLMNQRCIAWGIPFKYTVLPMGKGTEGETDGVATDARASYYSEIASCTATGWTKGYAMGLKASKATDPKKVEFNWESHNYYGIPTLYYRTSPDSAWIKAVSFNKGSLKGEYEVKDKDLRCKVLEYAITYNDDGNFVASYPEYLADDKLKEDGEQMNQGYPFTLPYFVPIDNSSGSFSETLQWALYDYESNRKKKPGDNLDGGDPYAIYIKNTNLGAKWYEIATISADGKITPTTKKEGYYAKIDITGDNASSSSSLGSITVTPTDVSSITDGRHTGLLEVLRDGRHYYSIVAKRKASSDDNAQTIITSLGGYSEDGKNDGDKDIFSYRQITNTEIARSALLVLSYGFYRHDGGDEELEKVNDDLKYKSSDEEDDYAKSDTGTMTFSKGSYDWGHAGKYYADYAISRSYAPAMLCPDGDKRVFAGIAQGDSFDGRVRIQGLSDYYIFQFPNDSELKVSFHDSKIPIDYSAVVKFRAESNKNVIISVKRGGQNYNVANTSDSSSRRKLFPMVLNEDKKYEIKNSTYGWWPAAE